METRLETALVVCTPGLEKELIKELQEIWPYLLSPQGLPHTEAFPEIMKYKGGVEVPCDLFRAVQINFFSHLATRVLWRIAEFKCRDFPKLFQHLKKIPWNQWLQSKNVNWQVAAAQSRLNNEKRITEVAVDAFKDVKIAGRDISYDVYIRIFNDVCTVSLDLSGDPLYKRLLNKKTGEAPFRETWAHFALRKMMGDIPLAELKKITLVDPFCGSGTFLFEGALFNFPNFRRHFAFQDLVRAPKLFKSENFGHNYKFPTTSVFKGLFGTEIEPKVSKIAEENLQSFKVQFPKAPFNITVRNTDALAPDRLPEGPLWLVANPPWGVRLGQQKSFEELVTKLVSVWKPLKMAIVVPAQSLDPSCISNNYEVQENISLQLGGTDVSLIIWNCKE
jgi:putative N6-adenine-specific DNA methylase